MTRFDQINSIADRLGIAPVLAEKVYNLLTDQLIDLLSSTDESLTLTCTKTHTAQGIALTLTLSMPDKTHTLDIFEHRSEAE